MNDKEIMVKDALTTRNIYKLKKIYLSDPTDLEVKYEYANLLLEFDVEKQMLGIDLLLELLNTSYKNKALISLAFFEYSNENFYNAEDIYERLISKVEQQRDYDSLKAFYSKISNSLSSKNEMIFFNALLSEDLGYNDLAVKFYRKLLNTELKSKALFKIGHIERKENKYRKSKGHLIGALRFSKIPIDYVQALFEFGKLEYQFENFEKSINSFQSILSTRNFRYKNMARLELAQIYFTKKDFEKSKQYILDSIDSNKNFAENYEKLLIFYIKTNDIESAKSILDYLISNDITIDKKIIALVCNKTGMSYSEIFDSEPSYILNQIDNYDIEEFKKNVYTNISLEDINKFLIEEYKIYKLTLFDEYLIPGYLFGKDFEYLKVMTIPNTKNVLEVYPVNNKYVEESKSKEINKTERISEYKKNKVKTKCM